jgi:hypothetical protein
VVGVGAGRGDKSAQSAIEVSSMDGLSFLGLFRAHIERGIGGEVMYRPFPIPDSRRRSSIAFFREQHVS